MYQHNGAAKTVSVVIPARNEAKNITWVLEHLPSIVDEVVMVDGGSVDDTVEVTRRLRPDAVIVQQARRGKGNALAAGFEAATGDLIVMIDADGSMDPREIEAYLEPLVSGADYAKGSRFTVGGGSDDITALRRAGNWGLNALTNLLFRSRYSDLCYGYNAFTRECVQAFALPPAHVPGARYGDGFEIETMINVRVVLADLAVVEVPSYEYVRRSGESNLNTFRDGFRVLGTILRERYEGRRRLVRVPASAPAAPVQQPVADGFEAAPARSL
jgi:glycosyltransferase involved in cell wall biosynthesis